MPRRSILSAAERESLLALPDTKDELIRHYTFSESDLSITVKPSMTACCSTCRRSAGSTST